MASAAHDGRLIFGGCTQCQAPLGPWEAQRCVSHRTDFSSEPITGLAAAALEQSEQPLPVHDVARIIKRDFGVVLRRGSLTSIMGAERWFCWAGKGVYGLYRHGLLPGPRTLAGVACFLLASQERPVHFDRLSFLMKWAGYRFQYQSLASALWNHELTTGLYDSGAPSVTGVTYRFGVSDPVAVQEWLLYEGTADTPEHYQDLLSVWRSRMRDADRERRRRLEVVSNEDGSGGALIDGPRVE